MKKTIKTMTMISGIALSLGLVFTSCKKDGTCTCTTTTTSTYTYGSTTTVDNSTSTSKSTYKKLNKQHANQICSSGTYISSSGSGTNTSTYNSTTDCKLE